MPADLFTRMNLDLVYPPFRDLAFQLAANCRVQGADYFATRGFATLAQQKDLHDLFIAGKGGRAAPAGLSAHNYGLAFDFTRDADTRTSGLQPVWHSLDYNPLGAEARKLGLVWGGSFGDRPHVQWPGFVSAPELEPLRKLWDPAKSDFDNLKTVWEHIDSLNAA